MNKTSKKMFLRKGLIFLMFLSLAVIVLQGCYPYDDQTVADADVVATFYDQGTNFSTLTTYYMPNRVSEIGSGGEIDTTADITYSQQILTAVNNNMEEMGFQATSQANADVLVEALVSSST